MEILHNVSDNATCDDSEEQYNGKHYNNLLMYCIHSYCFKIWKLYDTQF
jgi:hypothetical protein